MFSALHSRARINLTPAFPYPVTKEPQGSFVVGGCCWWLLVQHPAGRARGFTCTALQTAKALGELLPTSGWCKVVSCQMKLWGSLSGTSAPCQVPVKTKSVFNYGIAMSFENSFAIPVAGLSPVSREVFLHWYLSGDVIHSGWKAWSDDSPKGKPLKSIQTTCL